MRTTYSTASERRARPGTASKPAGGRGPELAGLVAATLVTLVGCLLLYQAKATRWGDVEQALAGGRLVNLNAVTSPGAILPLLSPADLSDSERVFLATRMVDDLTATAANGGRRRRIDSVGALARLSARALDIRAGRGLDTLRERAGARSGDEPVALVSAADLAAIHGSFVVRTPGDFRLALLLAVLILLAGFYGAHAVLRLRGSAADPLLLPVLHVLCGVGFLAMVSLRDPLRDAPLFLRFAEGVAAGCVLLAACAAVDLQRAVLRRLSYVPLAGAVLLSVLLIAFGGGPGASDAKVNLLGVQPVEAIRLLVLFFLAGYFATRWEFLRALREPTAVRVRVAGRRIDVPHLDYVVPVVAGMALVLLFFFFQKDLGPALVLSCVFLALYGVARNRAPMVVAGLLLLVLGFWAGYLLGFPRTVLQRVAMWRSPWENGLRGGDQVAHALWALASGGLGGTGLGLGEPQFVPAGHTDLVLSVVGEELGFAGIAAVFTLYGVLAYRGLQIARRAAGDYSFFLALGLTLSLVLQLVLIAGGQMGLLPLTGVVTPFLSYGRSSMLANFAAVGLLLAISARGVPRARNREFDRPLRAVTVVGSVLMALVLGRAAVAQVLRADRTAASAALTLQADGARRYTYNPRLLAAARLVVRGTIRDRNGVPLATSRAADLEAGRAALAGLGIDPARACPDVEARCYPFGGVTFHLLGDWRTRENWGAPNTSFEEREGDRRLRGYDDHAELIQVTDPRTGGPAPVIRRNYRDLLPLWSHRYRPGDAAVRAILDRPRDVRMTIDIRLQMRVAAALAAQVTRAGRARGAAVVLDGQGDLLAAVSYPWPVLAPAAGAPGAGDEVDERDDEALLDRARYGVYPPGSAFKVVTAAAALRTDPALAHATFVCERLPDGRVGQRIHGWSRPVRDDPADTVPHGTIDLPRALIVSCNAYFAQLGLRLGAAPLADTARLFEIPLTRPESAASLRDTLPFAAYGQGQVLATPFKMARVAATIANDGTMPYGRWVLDDDNPRVDPARAVIPPSEARVLARAMRAVVQSGTGRSLKDVRPAVAGKTGTAEVQGAPSHSWFIGFAPYDAPAGKRIAFAVIVENGGYGASAAAPVAGQIVAAAREIGIIK